jgi:DNA-binding NarL/FixJ family response regulator
VIDLIVSVHTNKDIARRGSLSVRTVERYSTLVMNKLGVQNRAELIAYVVGTGMVSGDTNPNKNNPRRSSEGRE